MNGERPFVLFLLCFTVGTFNGTNLAEGHVFPRSIRVGSRFADLPWCTSLSIWQRVCFALDVL